MLEIVIQEVLWLIRRSYSAIWSLPSMNVNWFSDSPPANWQDFSPISWPWYRVWHSQNYKWFLWSICNGCGMPAGNAYPFGHLVPSCPFWDLLFLQLLRPVFPNMSCLFTTYHLEYLTVVSQYYLSQQTALLLMVQQLWSKLKFILKNKLRDGEWLVVVGPLHRLNDKQAWGDILCPSHLLSMSIGRRKTLQKIPKALLWPTENCTKTFQ